MTGRADIRSNAKCNLLKLPQNRNSSEEINGKAESSSCFQDCETTRSDIAMVSTSRSKILHHTVSKSSKKVAFGPKNL